WLCGARPFEGSATEVMVQQLSMPPPPLRERVPSIPAEVEQVVLRALDKDVKARFASVQAFAEAFEQASRPASSSLVPLAAEPPSPGLASTVALASNQPGIPAETTPSADVPAGALEPTVYPDSSAPNGLDTPQGG